MWARCVRCTQAHPGWTLAAAWVFTRVLLVAQLAAFPDAFLGDVHLYAVWSGVLVQGQFPAPDPFWQYPPGAGVLFAALGLLGPAPVPAFIGLALVADAAILVMACRAVTRCEGAPTSWWAPTAWVIGGLAIGPVLLARFDLFPTALAVAAILALGRPRISGALAGLGALLKAWPLLLLLAVPRRRIPGALAAAISVIVIGALAIAAWAPGSLDFLDQQRDRGLQVESVGALVYVAAGAIGADPQIVLRFGAFEIQGVGVEQIGTTLTLVGLALLAGLALLRLFGRLESVPGGDVALLAVLISVATSRVLSPQYAVWLIGIGIAAACDPRSASRRATRLLIAMAAVTQVLFPWGYGSYLDTAAYAVCLQVFRIALLIWATAAIGKAIVQAARRGVGSESSSPSTRQRNQA